MASRPLAAIGAGILALALLLSGCGGSKGKGGSYFAPIPGHLSAPASQLAPR
jgi:hypothetical protein